MAASRSGQLIHGRPRRRQKRRGRSISALELADFRETTYRLLSQALLYPNEERLKTVAAVAGELWEEGDSFAQLASFIQWRQLLRSLEDLGEQDPSEIEREYVSIFVVNSAGIPCPPYESVYTSGTGQPSGELLAEVEREYASAGLALAPALGELPDHVAVELEFLALLCDREAQAWEKQSAERGVYALQQQKSFLDRHLAVWLPEFFRHVAAANGDGVYAALSEGVQAFISYDRDLLGALLETAPTEAKAS